MSSIESEISTSRLREFVAESNRIEGIHDTASLNTALSSHKWFLAIAYLRVQDVEWFTLEITDGYGELRRRPGMNVRVGPHVPPPGGPEIRDDLENLLDNINEGTLLPWRAHVLYETLHPFLDGNGRSGRAIWAWMMSRHGKDPFALPFLTRAYYQALDGAR